MLYPIIDLLKRIVVALPEYVKPSGGGVEITKTTYTHVEDWLDNLDSYQKFANAYFPNPSTFFYVAVINNTSTENFAGQSAVCDEVITNIMVCRRKASIGASTGSTFKIGAGSTITVYAIDGGAFT